MSHALFPYVLMPGDEPRTPVATLSDGIHLALIHVTTDGTSKVLYRGDLAELGQDPVTAYLDSRVRLTRLVRARLVRMRTVLGPGRVRCLAFEHSFLAASCVVLPGLFDLAQGELDAETMIVAVPRRDLLVVAPNLGWAFREDLTHLVGAEGRVLALEPSGPVTATPVVHGLRPYRRVVTRKRCA